MENLMKELERTCERSTKELHDLNDRLDNNKNMLSPQDLDILYKLMDVIKDIKSTIKKIYEIEDMESSDDYQNRYSGMYSGDYMTQPMWDRRYSGNSYRGQYTLETGDGRYSGRNMRRSYSRDTDRDNMRGELESMLRDSRDERESEVIRKLMTRL